MAPVRNGVLPRGVRTFDRYFQLMPVAGARVMNRFGVRIVLSVVGAVAVLGGAAVALHMFSGGESRAPDGAAGAQQTAEADDAGRATPIRTDEIAGRGTADTLKPPPPAAFTSYQPLRAVSHESATDAHAEPSADPIPTLGAGGLDTRAYSAYAPPAPVTAGGLRDENARGGDYEDGDPVDTANSTDFPTYDSPLRSPAANTAVPTASSSSEPMPRGVERPSSGTTPPADRTAPAAGVFGASPASSFPLGNPVESGTRRAGVDDDPARDDRLGGSTLRPGPEMTRPDTTGADAVDVPDGGSDLLSASGLRDRARGVFDAPAGAGAGGTGSSAAATREWTQQISPGSSMDTRAPMSADARSAGVTASAALCSDVPGDRALEGQQSPAIVLEKTAPDEIQVEKRTTFQIRVRNVGNAAAHNVVVVDQVPRGTDYIDSVPECAHSPDGLLVWNLKTLQAGEEIILAVNLLPKVAGEIGSVAQVTFQAQAAVRTICTKPELKVELKMPEQVLIGTEATVEIAITNTGSGAATNVLIEEDVPDGFTHAAGRQIETAIGALLPQESRRLSLILDATTPGVYDNRLTVRGDGNLLVEDVRKIEVATPKLEIAMQGPALRYLDRQATYVVRMANPGTAPARNVELVTFLPKGMKYVTSDNHGQYDSQTHAVYWSLEELPAETQGDVHVTVLPIEPGNHKLKANGHADLGLQHACEHEVVVEGLAELSFSVADVADPIEVGSQTTYEVRVRNRGSKADSDIRVMAELPPGMMPTSGDGPVSATVQRQRVLFNPLARLAPDEEAVFKIHATGQATGDHVIRVQLQSAELRVPVTKEEITRVYTDQ